MYIVNQDRDIVINMDNVTNVYKEGESKIMAETVTGEEIILGVYREEPKGADVFKEMLRNVFPPNLLMAQNCDVALEEFPPMGNNLLMVKAHGEPPKIERFDCGVYYMPEE